MKNVGPIILIVIGIYGFLVLAGMLGTPLTFFIILGLSLACLGSGIVLLIANQKYPKK